MVAHVVVDDHRIEVKRVGEAADDRELVVYWTSAPRRQTAFQASCRHSSDAPPCIGRVSVYKARPADLRPRQWVRVEFTQIEGIDELIVRCIIDANLSGPCPEPRCIGKGQNQVRVRIHIPRFVGGEARDRRLRERGSRNIKRLDTNSIEQKNKASRFSSLAHCG